MTRDQAIEAGMLATALDELASLRAKIAAREPDDVTGIGCSENHSDSGCEGIGMDVLLPNLIVEECLADIRARVEARLMTLGVQP